MLKVLILDNYDSFTYNLVHYVEGFDCQVDVILNDQITVKNTSHYDRIILSPGPGLPKDAGKLMEVIAYAIEQKIPLFGVCLGFQAIIEYFGGQLYNQQVVKHGVSEIASFNTSAHLFANLPENFNVGLYHSWAARIDNFPELLMITGCSEEGVIMAFEHKNDYIMGVQFHPESVLSEHGHKIVENFLFNFD